LLVLLDTTILTNFALAGLTSMPRDLWGNGASTIADVHEEYAADVETGGSPRVDTTENHDLVSRGGAAWSTDAS